MATQRRKALALEAPLLRVGSSAKRKASQLARLKKDHTMCTNELHLHDSYKYEHYHSTRTGPE